MDIDFNVLFLDDNRVRHEVFKSWYDKADCCYTFDQCIALLRTKPYDVVSLDHDLSDVDVLCKPDLTNKERTGTDVARFITQLLRKPKVAILHSYNTEGARIMAKILKTASVTTYLVPFGFDKQIYSQLREIAS